MVVCGGRTLPLMRCDGGWPDALLGLQPRWRCQCARRHLLLACRHYWLVPHVRHRSRSDRRMLGAEPLRSPYCARCCMVLGLGTELRKSPVCFLFCKSKRCERSGCLRVGAQRVNHTYISTRTHTEVDTIHTHVDTFRLYIRRLYE